ncbi:MGDG synthase family glycosyltransferase [Haliangium ochraceum]|uniref:Diacylglycerol glucosyltransferase N-terminal domain-containing protein n=1 Tax=Haliangium ochraceum (strain DSM 14365 / JCM 11303 / SMP-2) TaxID=502025 RepID=D0LWA0_HALO1|nr:hypothetical protein [Haliangium ochraceum]ACY16032.1 hypothetical protein Hoch_3530 [Haliangium ochraceum DSM 14365]
MSSKPAVLLVTSTGAPEGGVTPVLAALEAADLSVRAIDVGRAGSRSDGAIDKVLQALAGEVAERRLLRELSSNPPDVSIAFDPATAAALSAVRDQGHHPAPVVAIVAEMQPDSAWSATDADRYLTVDEDAAAELAELGVDGSRIIPIGALCPWRFLEAAGESKDSLRERFKITAGDRVVVVDVAGFGYEQTSQIALQLSLVASKVTYLFDAGGDAEAATALRRQVPTLDMRAKLFGKTADAARYWRCADVVITRPSAASVARGLALGARMVAFMPEGSEGTHNAKGLEARGLGTTATTTLLLSSALEPLLAQAPRSDSRVGMDGAGNVADIAWVVGSERREILSERQAEATSATRERVRAAAGAAEAASRASAAAGGLEDLGGGGGGGDAPDPPRERDVAALRAEVRMRQAQVGKTVGEARTAADRWRERADNARRHGDENAAREAERQADAERARMHAALAEMSQLQGELERLESTAAEARRSAPRSSGSGSSGGSRASTGSASSAGAARSRSNVDDLLDQMKRQQSARPEANKARSAPRTPVAEERTIDDELDALKRKMQRKKKR